MQIFFSLNSELEDCMNGAIAVDEALEKDSSDTANMIDAKISTTMRPVTITKSASFIEGNQNGEKLPFDEISTTSSPM